MITLVKFELKKLLDKKIAVFAVLAILFLTIQSGLSFSYSVSSSQYSVDGINYIYGHEAVEKNQKLIEKYAGNFSDNTVQQIIDDFDLQKNIDKRKNGEINGYEIFNKPSYIYNSATALVMDKFVDGNGNIASVSEITNNPDKLFLEYSETYKEFMMDLGTMSSIFVIFTIICIAPVFNQEYSSCCDSIILSSKYGKNKAVIAKLLASFIFITLFFFIMIVILFNLEIMNFGMSGANASVDLMSFMTKNSLTMLTTALLSVLFVYIGVMFIMMITMILSSFVNSFTTLIIAMLIYIVPVIIASNADIFLTKLLMFLPGVFIGNGTLLGMQNIDYYNLFNLSLDVPATVMIVACISCIVLGWVSYLNFKNHQVV